MMDDNSLYNPQAAPSHEETLYVKMIVETDILITASHLSFHNPTSPCLHYLYLCAALHDMTLNDHMDKMHAPFSYQSFPRPRGP